MNKVEQLKKIEADVARLRAEIEADSNGGAFTPELGDTYWFVRPSSGDSCYNYDYKDDAIDNALMRKIPVFRDPSEVRNSTLFQMIEGNYEYKLPSVSCHLDKIPEEAQYWSYQSKRWVQSCTPDRLFAKHRLYRWKKG
jgi:hypothetical protein